MKAKSFYQKLTTWPKPFTILEIMIVIIGVVAASLLYLGISSTNTLHQIARSYDRDSRQMVTSASLAYIRFNALLEGNSTANIDTEVFSLVDEAQSLCSDIVGGGPGGQFKPSTTLPTIRGTNQALPDGSFPGENGQKPVDLCRQLSDWRALIGSR
jgi:hypothetical protein